MFDSKVFYLHLFFHTRTPTTHHCTINKEGRKFSLFYHTSQVKGYNVIKYGVKKIINFVYIKIDFIINGCNFIFLSFYHLKYNPYRLGVTHTL